MQHSLIKNLIFVLFVNILVKAIWVFAIDRNVQILVGYQSYGSYQSMLNLALIFQIILDFGFTQYTGKAIAEEPQRMVELFPTMLWSKFLLSIVYIIVVLSFAYIIGYASWQIVLLMSVLSITIGNSFIVFLRSNIAALHYFKTDGILAVIDRLIMILICGYLIFVSNWANVFKIEWFIFSQVFSYGITILIASIVIFKISSPRKNWEFKIQPIINVLKESSPYALLIFLMSIYMRSDVVMIERLCGQQGDEQAGIYASAFRLLDVSNIFGVMFAGILMPTFSKMFAKKENIAPIVRTAVDIMLPIAIIIAIIVQFYSPQIMTILYHKKNVDEASVILKFLMWSYPAYCLMYIYSTLLTARGSIVLLNKISFIIVCLNLLLHYIFISYFQAIGAAIVVLICELIVASIIIWHAHKACQLPHNYTWLLKHTFYIITLLSVSYATTLLNLILLLKILIILSFALLLLYVLKIWSIKNFKTIISLKS